MWNIIPRDTWNDLTRVVKGGKFRLIIQNKYAGKKKFNSCQQRNLSHLQ